MTKKSLILAFFIILVGGFVVGYVTMAFDIKDGIMGRKDNRSVWQILPPF